MLDDIQKWQVEQLASNGGFSDLYIAEYVFEKPQHRISKKQVTAITRYRHRIEVKLGDWRNGRTSLAQSHASGVISRRRKQKRA